MNSEENEKTDPEPEGSATSGDAAPEPEQTEAPPARPDFRLFLHSLGLQALMHMGEIPRPGTEEVETDLAQAKYAIDLVQLLRDKTRGNLTDEESRFLDGLLYDLRMKYVARMSGG